LGVEDSDLVLDVMGSMNLCVSLGDLPRAWRLRTLIEERRNSPIGKTAWTLLQWVAFIGYEDYDSLVRFSSSLAEIRGPLQPRNVLMEPSLDMLEQFANAVLIENGRYISFARARQLASELSIDPERLVKSILEREGTMMLLEALEFLYRAADSESIPLLSSNLRHAVETLQVFSAVEQPNSPNRLTQMKTELLEEMMRGDKERVSSLAQSIANHPFISETASELSRMSMDWVNSEHGKTDTVIAALTQDAHPQSPWIRIARRIVNENAREAYGRVVRDRARLIQKPIAVGGQNYRRGKQMESLLQLHFIRKGFTVQPRLILEGIEAVDIFCYKRLSSHVEIAFVDVKRTKKKYGPLEARDFAGRIRELRRSISFLLPFTQKESVKMVAIVASTSGLSEKGKSVLRRQLEGIPLKIVPTSMLKRLLSSGEATGAIQNAEADLGMTIDLV
jgi:hypothetical protein